LAYGEIPSINVLVTTKDQLRAHPQEFEVPHAFGRLLPVTHGETSGTSGFPLRVRRTLSDVAVEEAFQKWWRGSLGWTAGSKVAILRGAFPKEFELGQLHVPLPGTERFLINTFRIGPETVREILGILRAKQPSILYAYPSAVTALSRMLSDMGETYQGLTAIVTSSETFATEDRAFVERVFGCKVFDWYGNAERSVAAGQCSLGRYHFFQNYVDVQIDPSGQIIGTPLRWNGMQIANYLTGDLLEDFQTVVCGCGWRDPHARAVIGRLDDFLIAGDNSHVGRLDAIFRNEPSIYEAQIRQKQDGELVLSLVSPSHDRQAMDRMIKRLAQRVPGRTIHADFVDSIQRTPAGKLKSVIRDYQL
jgi:phenylacetate-CoA ligase